MDEKLTIINSSNDTGNSQIVIFQPNAGADDFEAEPVFRTLLAPGALTNFSPADGAGNHVYKVEAQPELIEGQPSQPAAAVTMQPGDTAYITGDAISGYSITIKN